MWSAAVSSSLNGSSWRNSCYCPWINIDTVNDGVSDAVIKSGLLAVVRLLNCRFRTECWDLRIKILLLLVLMLEYEATSVQASLMLLLDRKGLNLISWVTYLIRVIELSFYHMYWHFCLYSSSFCFRTGAVLMHSPVCLWKPPSIISLQICISVLKSHFYTTSEPASCPGQPRTESRSIH